MFQCNVITNASLQNRSEWKQGSHVTFSSLRNCVLEKDEPPTYSVKYVLSGTEHYFIDGKKHSVSAGEFLVVNKDRRLDAVVKSQKEVKGFCIHVGALLIQEIFTMQTLSDSQLLNDPASAEKAPEMRELIYAVQENSIGLYLQRLVQLFNEQSGALNVTEEDFFHHIACGLFQLQNRLPAAEKLVTRNSVQQELQKRLQLAKTIMDEGCSENINVDFVAQQAMLSTSHFFRLFKKAYKISPYQYLQQKRLKNAHEALLRGGESITQTAFRFGFADAAAFNKAYKKQHGLSPLKTLQLYR